MAATWKPMVIPTPKQPFHQKKIIFLFCHNPQTQNPRKRQKRTKRRKKKNNS